MKHMKLLISLVGLTLLQNVFAASSFEELTPRLQRVLQCDTSEFPRNKIQQNDLKSFNKSLRKSGIKIKTFDDGPEQRDNYILPTSLIVFGTEIKLIENYRAPFIVIDLPISPAELAKRITTMIGIKFKHEGDSYGSISGEKIKVQGRKFPFQQTISIYPSDSIKKGSSYICNFADTDPDALDV